MIDIVYVNGTGLARLEAISLLWYCHVRIDESDGASPGMDPALKEQHLMRNRSFVLEEVCGRTLHESRYDTKIHRGHPVSVTSILGLARTHSCLLMSLVVLRVRVPGTFPVGFIVSYPKVSLRAQEQSTRGRSLM